MPSGDISARILRRVSSKDYHPQRAGKLARALGVDEHEYGDFRAAVKALMRAGRVMRGGDQCIMLPDAADTIVGTFRGNPRGFGFVVPESPADHGDLFIPPGSSLDAITGDTVSARITRRGKSDDGARVRGEIVEVIERGQSRFVGELVRDGKKWLMLPDGHSLHAPVLIGDARSTRAKAGDQVVVELTTFPSEDGPARGVIVEVLGRRGDPGVDTLSIIRQYHFPEAFSDELLDETRAAIHGCDLEDHARDREDLRSEVVVTIDPDDAKDFDDAISLRKVGRGGLELGIHIADVSTLVQPGSLLDEEAQRRGNSIYLPRHVIPMLPEVLSNGLCSLQEGEPRLVKSAFIRYDARGRRKATRFANSIIQSRKRLTYKQATNILDGKTRGFGRDVIQLVGEMDRLARRIRKRRLADGMIVLDLPDVELVLDDDNEAIDVEPADTSFSHTIIEMFMVEANDVVSELLTELEVPHLRRIHPDPPPTAQKKLTDFLRVLGQPIPDEIGRAEMIRLLDDVRNKPESFAVNLGVLRSMARAEYSPKQVGHFALASAHYAHFTSPIRRYPDLTVHRLLEMYLRGKLRTRRGRKSAPSTDTLTEVGRHCSFTERRAEDAERELRLVKILRLLEKHVGDLEDGVVTGLTNVGVFVQLRKYLVDGLIRFADMTDDWWEINPRGGCVVGQRSGRRITIGDSLAVQIAGVDVAARELDLVMIETTTDPPRRAASKAKAGKTRTRKKQSAKKGRRTGKAKVARGSKVTRRSKATRRPKARRAPAKRRGRR